MVGRRHPPDVPLRLLCVGVEEEHFGSLTDAVNFASLWMDSVTPPEQAIELLALYSYDAIVAEYRALTPELQPFLDAVRADGSPARAVPLILLAAPGDLAEAHTYVGRGVNRVLPLAQAPYLLQLVLPPLLDVAPRVPVRTPVHLVGRTEGASTVTRCATVNVSRTGMLIETPKLAPPGTLLAFELAVADDQGPVRGYAEVIRHASPERERIQGLGVRFRSFRAEDEARFSAYLDLQAS